MSMEKNERFDQDGNTRESGRYAEFTDEQIVEMSHNGDSAAEEYLLDKYKNFVFVIFLILVYGFFDFCS